MPRKPSPFTEAVRNLLDRTNGEIKYEQARQEMAKMGLPVAPEVGEKSKELQAVEQYDFNRKQLAAALRGKNAEGQKVDPQEAENLALEVLQPIFDELEFSVKQRKAVLEELKARQAYEDEKSYFEVIKHGWRKQHGLVGRRGRPAKTEAKTGKRGRGRPRKEVKTAAAAGKVRTLVPTQEELSALETLDKLGGVDGVRKEIERLKAQVGELQQQLKTAVRYFRRASRVAEKIEKTAA